MDGNVAKVPAKVPADVKINPSASDTVPTVPKNNEEVSFPRMMTSGTTPFSENEKVKEEENAEMGDFYVEDGLLKKLHGYNWLVAALFIVADMAGTGIVALPSSIIKASFYPGIILICVMAALSTVSAILLGKAWMVMLRMYPAYRTHCRRPYPEMGYRAMGVNMKSFVSIILLVTQFGVSTTFLLLVSTTSADLLQSLTAYRMNNCIVILAMGFALLPFTFQKSPKDFWLVIMLGTLSTAIAVVLIFVGTVADHQCAKGAKFPPFNIVENLRALGVYLFTYGGHAIFPTIQNDMRVPSHFSRSSLLAFTLITIMNLIVILSAGYIYGDSMSLHTVILSIQTVWIQRVINLMITLHCFLTFPLMVNPINQDLESRLNISLGYDLRRFASRSILMGAITFTALSIPNFEYFMSLIGGSSIVLTTMVMPAFFYILLTAKERTHYARQLDSTATLTPTANGTTLSAEASASTTTIMKIEFKELWVTTDTRLLAICIFMFVMGLAACFASTTSSIWDITNLIMTNNRALMPCYLPLIFPSMSTAINETATEIQQSQYQCCGLHYNLSLNGDASKFCMDDPRWPHN